MLQWTNFTRGDIPFVSYVIMLIINMYAHNISYFTVFVFMCCMLWVYIPLLDVPVEVECYHSLFPLEPESSPTPDKVQLLHIYVAVTHSINRMYVCIYCMCQLKCIYPYLLYVHKCMYDLIIYVPIWVQHTYNLFRSA